MKQSTRNLLVVFLILVALISAFVISKVVTTPAFNASAINSLEEKKATVMKLTVTAAASSTALSLLPGDVATPIASQIAELSTYFIFILGAILLEKILLSVMGYITFTFMIPAACCLGILYLFFNREVLLNLALRLAVFGLVLFFTIPVSVNLSDLVYASYQTSIEQSIETAEDNNAAIEDKKSEFAKADRNWLEKVGDYISDVTSKIGADIQGIVKRGEDSLASFIDAIATMLVISCVIPLVVIFIFVYLLKLMFGLDISRLVLVRRSGE